MTYSDRIIDSLEYIDDELLEGLEAAPESKRRPSYIKSIGALAACAAAAALVLGVGGLNIRSNDAADTESVSEKQFSANSSVIVVNDCELPDIGAISALLPDNTKNAAFDGKSDGADSSDDAQEQSPLSEFELISRTSSGNTELCEYANPSGRLVIIRGSGEPGLLDTAGMTASVLNGREVFIGARDGILAAQYTENGIQNILWSDSLTEQEFEDILIEWLGGT